MICVFKQGGMPSRAWISLAALLQSGFGEVRRASVVHRCWSKCRVHQWHQAGPQDRRHRCEGCKAEDFINEAQEVEARCPTNMWLWVIGGVRIDIQANVFGSSPTRIRGADRTRVVCHSDCPVKHAGVQDCLHRILCLTHGFVFWRSSNPQLKWSFPLSISNEVFHLPSHQAVPPPISNAAIPINFILPSKPLSHSSSGFHEPRRLFGLATKHWPGIWCGCSCFDSCDRTTNLC